MGGLNAAVSKLKKTGTDYWEPPNAEATNETGFSALPGGFLRDHDGQSANFYNINEAAHFWVSEPYSQRMNEDEFNSHWLSEIMSYGSYEFYWGGHRLQLSIHSKRIGAAFAEVAQYSSVRCVKD